MESRYDLEWLDSLVTTSLNPSRTKLDEELIPPEQIQSIISRIEEEKIRHQTFLNKQAFSLLNEKKIEVLIRQYYAALIHLLDQAWHNKDNSKFKDPRLKEIQLSLIRNLEELTAYIESRFPSYLDMDQRASINHLVIIKKELVTKVEGLRVTLEQKVNHKPLTDIVFSVLDTFLSNIKPGVVVTLRDALYIKGLVLKLQDLSEKDYISCSPAGLNELLIYLDFNSQAYITYLTQAIKDKVDAYPDVQKQLETLRLLRKDFYQMNCKPGVAWDIQGKGLKTVVGNWFSQELQFLELKLEESKIWINESLIPARPIQSGSVKFMCALSVDQIAVFLRALFESKIIIANSLNILFKQIVPFLSTPYKDNISADSMRSKSYAAEERDKDKLIQILEKLISIIRDF